MERLLALVILIIVSPFLFLVFIAVRITSVGPFVFKQKRLGKDKRPFEIFKIRTMVVNAQSLKSNIKHLNESDGPVFKIWEDPRYTFFGKILSHSGLDEILQLINIVKGEMSFVGPRPLPVEEANNVPERYRSRISILPGITSPWVISGTHSLTFKQWMESDLEYIKQKNIFQDLVIILITILLIVKWNSQKIFTLTFPFILLFAAIYPDFLWMCQILIFCSVVMILGLDIRRKPSILLVVLIGTLAISTYFSINRINSVPVFFSYLVCILLASFFKEENKQTLIAGYVLGAVMIGFLSVFYTVFHLASYQLPSFFSFINNGFNLVIPYFGQAFYGIYLIATFPFILERNFRKQYFFIWRIIFIVYIVLLVLTFSKITIIISIFEIILFVIFSRKNNSTLVSLKPVLIVLVIFSLLEIGIFVGIAKNRWLEKKVVKDSIPSRLEYWQQSKQAIIKSPFARILTGYGLDTFFELSNKYQSQPDYWVRSAHNFFIQFYIENGIFAEILLILYLFTTIKNRYRFYSFAQKVTIFSLLLFSCGNTVDINHFPALLFLLIIINKKTDYKAENNHILFPAGIVILGLIVTWTIYLYVYINFSFFNRINPEIINIFPYESLFWNNLIRKSESSKSLIQIDKYLGNYSLSNADVKGKTINKFLEYKDYCNALNYSIDYLTQIPFDLTVLEVLNQSKDKCLNANRKKLDIFFQNYKRYLDVSDQVLFQMRKFLFSTSIYYLKNKNPGEYEYWFLRAWRMNESNASDYWSETAFIDNEYAIPVNKPFTLHLEENYEENYFKEISGITLIGKINPDKKIWGKGNIKLFIGFSADKKKLYISAFDGKSGTPITLLYKEIKGFISSLVIRFNRNGKNLSISDEKNNLIVKIDVNSVSKNRFPQGLFPEGKLYLGYGIASHSALKIQKMLIVSE